MISKVKGWKDNQGKQFSVLEMDEYNSIKRIKTLIFSPNVELTVGHKIWGFDDSFRGIKALLETQITYFHEDKIHVSILTKVSNWSNEVENFKLEKTAFDHIKLEELKDNLFYINLFETHMKFLLDLNNIK